MTDTLPIPGSAAAEPFQAGVYDGMPDDVYHADPVPGGSLSASGARRLLPPSCPALYRYERDHGRPPKREFDFGHAAHREVLGVGLDLHVVDAPNWKSPTDQQAARDARDAGQVPLLTAEYDTVKAIAAAIRAHPVAGPLLNPSRGKPERSVFWQDQRTGVWRRARLDWTTTARDGRTVVVDLKSCRSAAPDRLQKAMWDYGYAAQSAWYREAAQAAGLGGKDTLFVFVFVEKVPPYLITVAEPDPFALQVGAFENRAAIDLYAECVQSGRWPGYADGRVATVGLPRWVESMYAKELSW